MATLGASNEKLNRSNSLVQSGIDLIAKMRNRELDELMADSAERQSRESKGLTRSASGKVFAIPPLTHTLSLSLSLSFYFGGYFHCLFLQLISFLLMHLRRQSSTTEGSLLPSALAGSLYDQPQEPFPLKGFFDTYPENNRELPSVSTQASKEPAPENPEHDKKHGNSVSLPS